MTEINKEQANLVKETGNTLIFKANKPLTDIEFKLLSDLVRHEEKKSGLNIVLLPHSADLVGLGGIDLGKTEEPQTDNTSDENKEEKQEKPDDGKKEEKPAGKKEKSESKKKKASDESKGDKPTDGKDSSKKKSEGKKEEDPADDK